jgi:hypothetical protein
MIKRLIYLLFMAVLLKRLQYHQISAPKTRSYIPAAEVKVEDKNIKKRCKSLKFRNENLYQAPSQTHHYWEANKAVAVL